MHSDHRSSLRVFYSESIPKNHIAHSHQWCSFHFQNALYNRSQRPLFEKNTAKFTEWGVFVMQNLVFVYAIVFVMINIVIDLTIAWLDPRIRFQ